MKFTQKQLDALAIAFAKALRDELNDPNMFSSVYGQVHVWNVIESVSDMLERNSTGFKPAHFTTTILHYAHLNRNERREIDDIVRNDGEDAALYLTPQMFGDGEDDWMIMRFRGDI